MNTPAARRLFGCTLLVVLSSALGSTGAPRGDRISFAARIEAQRVIERVYRSHRLETPAAAPDVTDEILERKVRTYLAQSEALASFWHVPITPQALSREMARIRRDTLFPERLAEIERLLGHDDMLIAETLARGALADRLSRSFLASDERVQPRLRQALARVEEAPDDGDESGSLAEVTWESWWAGHAAAYEAAAMARVPAAPRRSRTRTPIEEFLPDRLGREALPSLTGTGQSLLQDVWSGGRTEAIPAARRGQTAVWTGSEMIVWGGQSSTAYLASGSRYDPLTDTWTSMSLVGAPQARYEHTAVWTGHEMIVWGGGGSGSTFQSGGRYDPATDTWIPTSLTGAPDARRLHAAVWTGHEMVIWGGSTGPYPQTGGRYNPATDTWAPTSTVNAPSGRIEFAYVWTGTEMIVFGGFFTSTGGRYNPATDTWTPTSTVGAQSPRDGPLAVWTGQEMVVWGGFGGGFPPAGARYNPATDTWSPTNQAGAPGNRYNHSMVWTGHDVIVWGGTDFSHSPPSELLSNGSRYDPATDTWSAMTGVNAPSPRFGHSAVWTGSLMIVWGGNTASGGRYDPVANTWSATAFTPRTPGARADHTAVWTGSEMLVWGGAGAGADKGGRYDPLLDGWFPISTVGAPTARSLHSAVWTGEKMIVWGGRQEPLGHYQPGGGRYDPVTDAWQPVSTLGAPAPREGHTAVWTGDRMVVWGGSTVSSDQDDGALYDPATDVWEPMASLEAPSPRSSHTSVWTGDEMIVWGGNNGGSTGGRYDPAADVWSPTSLANAPLGRIYHTAVWSGHEMIVWGGAGTSGGRYDPASDTWLSTSLTGAPSFRSGHSAVWTGDEMIVWGGAVGSLSFSQNFNDGARYDPGSDAWTPMTTVGAPGGRYGHSAVWTGAAMIVWGGRFLLGDVIQLAENPRVPWYGSLVPLLPPDEDEDGFTPEDGDCVDTDPAIHPGAMEMPGNVVDENCDGVAMCNPARAWRTHGGFVACVVRACNRMVAAGQVLQGECRAMQQAASHSRIGWR